MSTTFLDIDCSLDIISEEQYNKDTGKQLLTISENSEQCIILDNNSIESLYNVKKDDNTYNNKYKGIGVLETATVKTSNSFLNTVQVNEQEKIQREKDRINKADIEFPYIKSELLTDAEIQLFRFMKNNLCQTEKIFIFPKIRLGDLVSLDTKITTDMKYFWKVTNKHVDYIICRADNLKIICAVELDDYTHESQEAKDRDIFVMQVLDTVGIKTVRIRSKIKTIDRSDLALVDEYINRELAPPCPYCGTTMIPRKCMSGTNKGHRFYGCQNYLVNCRYTIDIDRMGEKLP